MDVRAVRPKKYVRARNEPCPLFFLVYDIVRIATPLHTLLVTKFEYDSLKENSKVP
jgi:hypothetical protein